MVAKVQLFSERKKLLPCKLCFMVVESDKQCYTRNSDNELYGNNYSIRHDMVKF